MKTTITVLVAIIVMTLTASASPTLLVDTTLTEPNAGDRKDVLTAPSVKIESGKQAIIQVGNLEYAVTPTLQKDGTVDLLVNLTEHNGEKADKLETRLTAKLGQMAEIKIGKLTFGMITSLVE